MQLEPGIITRICLRYCSICRQEMGKLSWNAWHAAHEHCDAEACCAACILCQREDERLEEARALVWGRTWLPARRDHLIALTALIDELAGALDDLINLAGELATEDDDVEDRIVTARKLLDTTADWRADPGWPYAERPGEKKEDDGL